MAQHLIKGSLTNANSSNGSHRLRSHRHHHRHHYSSQSRRLGAGGSGGGEHNLNQSQTVAGHQFDANRRGLQQEDRASPARASSSIDPVSSVDQANKQTAPPAHQASANLRDRIARLIKDIVVHHGDNIQYVQLDPTTQRQLTQQPAQPDPPATDLGSSSGSSPNSASGGGAGGASEEDDLPLIRKDSAN